MTPDKVFQILSGIGIASTLFWWGSVRVWHANRPSYRVSTSRDPGPTMDEWFSVLIGALGLTLIAISAVGVVAFSEYPPMTFIGFFLYTTVRFFSESRKNTGTVQEIPQPV